MTLDSWFAADGARTCSTEKELDGTYYVTLTDGATTTEGTSTVSRKQATKRALQAWEDEVEHYAEVGE